MPAIRLRDKWKTAQDAVARLATVPVLTCTTGKYFDQKNESIAIFQAYKKKDRQRLWKVSEEFTELSTE